MRRHGEREGERRWIFHGSSIKVCVISDSLRTCNEYPREVKPRVLRSINPVTDIPSRTSTSFNRSCRSEGDCHRTGTTRNTRRRSYQSFLSRRVVLTLRVVNVPRTPKQDCRLFPSDGIHLRVDSSRSEFSFNRSCKSPPFTFYYRGRLFPSHTWTVHPPVHTRVDRRCDRRTGRRHKVLIKS